jgi:predicted enzyme related to lactoylglutathione lyase
VPGRFSWHELMTTDYQRAFEFYRKLFGWDKTGEMDMGGGNKYFMYGKGQPFGGIFNRHGDMANMKPFWLVYIYVKDVDKAVAMAKKNGAFVQRPPMDVPGGGRIAILGDPQGAAFALHSQKEAATASKPAAKKSASKARKSRAAAKKSARSAKRAGAKKRGGAKKARGGTKRGGTKKRVAAKKRPAAKKTARRRR